MITTVPIKLKKYKDDDPINTVTKARNILNDLGILTVETMWSQSANNFFSVAISVVNSTLSTNGKGTTYEYALASAYGELMERLQNLAPFHLNTDVSQEALEYMNFFYAPDEKQLSDYDILNSQEEWLTEKLSKLNIDKQYLISKWKTISYEDIPCDFIAVPFCNLNSKKRSYIPIKMLSKMYMSNGMCAGNTPEEALVQGISETLERYVNKRIINEKITPPTIPREFFNKYVGIIKLIAAIESSGNFEIILKDCSLEQGFPVIGVVFIDKDTQSYFVKFGAHPIFEIAVERTLTELLQGQDIEKMKGTWEFSYNSLIKNTHRNLMNILVNGCGEYPIEFFSSHESFTFKELIDNAEMSNREMLHYLVQLLKHSGYEVLARDVSFLGFPCFHVIVPGISEIEEIDAITQLDDYSQFVTMKKMLRNMKILNNQDLMELASFIEHRNLGSETTVLYFLNIPTTSTRIPWYYSNFDLLSIAIYCITGNYSRCFEKIQNLIISLKANSNQQQIITYYKCLRDYLSSKADKLNNEQALQILLPFYPIQMIKGIIDEVGEPEHIFINHPPIHCFDCTNCSLNPSCPYIQTERVYKILKESYAESGINETAKNYV